MLIEKWRMTRTSINVVIAATLLLGPVVRSQSSSGAKPQPRFDAASVKRVTLGSPPPQFDQERGYRGREHGRYTLQHTSLKWFLGIAYHIPPVRVLGPAWIESERYDVAAIMPPDTPEDQVLLMLQNLLKERLQINLHVEERQTAVYALIVDKNGPKLNKATEGKGPSGTARPKPFGYEITNSSMEMLATALSLRTDRPVIDRTGLSGTYDVTLDWSAYQSLHSADHTTPADGMPVRAAEAMRVSTDTSAILRSLAGVGLRAEPRKIPLKFLIVDRAEKIPIED
jgi:uncharacterized protein (TIGR03435 family)